MVVRAQRSNKICSAAAMLAVAASACHAASQSPRGCVPPDSIFASGFEDSGVAQSPAPRFASVYVCTAEQLAVALAAAVPGETIYLADGEYVDNFQASVPGTPEQPITLVGSRSAVLTTDNIDGGSYALYLNGANYWHLQGFTLSTSKKGLVLDGSSHVIIEGLHVTNIGQEGIHLRLFSSDNIVRDNDVDHTGMIAARFGEGIYVGSATSNWPNGQPDTSDRNQIVANRIVATAAENIDLKEGTTGGLISANYFDGSAIAGENSADSWIDVKGNGYLIENNHGVNSLLDGFQVHVVADGWGANNTFSNNLLEVNAPGVGIWVHNSAVPLNNVIYCNNVVMGAAAGDYATNHYDPLPCVP